MDTISTVTKRGQNIDCRELCMNIMLYKLDVTTAYDVVLFVKEELEKLFADNTIFRWMLDRGYTVSQKVNDKLLRCKNDSKSCITGFEGLFKSDVVFNKVTWIKYQKELFFNIKPKIDIPVDYKDEFHRYFKPGQSPDEVKRTLIEFMNLPNKKPICEWTPHHDFWGTFVVVSYEKYPNLFRGQVQFSVNAEAVKSCIDEVAQSLKTILYKVTIITSNVSGCISLVTESGHYTGYSHMSLFCSSAIEDRASKREGFLEFEWAPYSYVCGVEWWNLISSWQRERISFDSSQASDNVLIEELDSGGLIVGSKKSIIDTDIGELREMKKLLYDALYPGKSRILKKHFWDEQSHTMITKPRYRWANIPIFEEEVNVTDEFIEFRHG